MEHIQLLAMSIVFVAWQFWFIRRMTKSWVNLAIFEKDAATYKEMHDILKKVQERHTQLMNHFTLTDVATNAKIWELRQTVNQLIDNEFKKKLEESSRE